MVITTLRLLFEKKNETSKNTNKKKHDDIL